MKKLFAVAFSCALAFAVGCSGEATSPAPQPEATQQDSKVSTDAVQPNKITCPLEWECLQGPNAGAYYTNLSACSSACGGSGNCSRDYKCSLSCYCP
jgi:hypothetical protein